MLKPAMQIISESWQLYKKNWRQLMPYLLALFVPTLVLSTLGTIFIYLELYLPASRVITTITILLIVAASIVLTVWASIALVKAIAAHLSGQTLGWKENFSSSNHLIWPAIYTAIFVALLSFMGSILFIIPGIIFAVWYCFTSYIVVLENLRGMPALRASKALVVGRWWSVAWRLICIGLLIGLINVIIIMVLDALIQLLPLATFLQSTIGSLASSLIGVIITPLSVAAGLILYFSAKQTPAMEVTPTNPPQV